MTGLTSGLSGKQLDFEPVPLCLKGLATTRKWPKRWTANGRQVGKPAALAVRLDMTGTADRETAQGGQVNRLVVKARYFAIGTDQESHRAPCYRCRRRMFRRGRSTSKPSSTDCTPESRV